MKNYAQMEISNMIGNGAHLQNKYIEIPLQCPNPMCQEGKIFYVKRQKAKVQKARCPICQHRFCIQCKLNHKRTETCDQYRQYLQKLDSQRKSKEEEKKFQADAAALNLARCPVCKFFVEKSSGCNRMSCWSPTCKGKVNFCYLCNKNLTNHQGISPYTHFYDGTERCKTQTGEKDAWEV